MCYPNYYLYIYIYLVVGLYEFSRLYFFNFTVDVRVPFFFEFVPQAIFFCSSQLVVACVVYPLFSVAVIFILTVFLALDRCMSRGIFEARRLDNQTKSSVVHDLSTVLTGVRIIRAFQRESLFQKRYFTVQVLQWHIGFSHLKF